MATAKFKRILLKLSGEALMGEQDFGICHDMLGRLADELVEIHRLGVELALVVGGGNFFRGAAASAGEHMDRVSADHMGMLATLINSLALQDALERRGLATRVLSALEIRQVAEPFLRRRALRHLEKGRAIILAAGTGNPYFTTDSAAALRANELSANILLKATGVDGIYTADPKLDPNATRLSRVSYQQVLERNLRVMDAAAISLCSENDVEIIVFELMKQGNFGRVVTGETIGSSIGA